MTTSTTTVLEQVKQAISSCNAQLDNNIQWLRDAINPLFFRFNESETKGISMLANNLNELPHFRRLTLVDREDKAIIAQLDELNSIYNAFSRLPAEREIKYAEITTSSADLPNADAGLEVIRLDYGTTVDSDIVAKAHVEAPEMVYHNVCASLKEQGLALDADKAKHLLNILWQNNEDYVQVSPPGRIARVLNMFNETRKNDGFSLDMNLMPEAGRDGLPEYRLLLGISNPPQKGFLLQILNVFRRLNLGVARSYVVKVSDGVYPFLLSTFYVSHRDGTPLEKDSELFRHLQLELYNVQTLSTKAPVYEHFVQQGITSGVDATLINAITGFCHTNLAHNNQDAFDLEGIQRAFYNHPDISQQLLKLFYARFDPHYEGDRASNYETVLAETIETVNNFNSGRRFMDEFRRTIFRCAISFIQNCLKTNFFVPEKYALAFRLDPAYLEDLGDQFTADLPSDRPFRITYFSGRNGLGYHIGFSDIARGGWRTLMTQGRDDYISSANTIFKENYVLAHTQHLKNKDIYEGGSKMVAILNTRQGRKPESVLQYLYKLQFGFINAFLDIYVTDESGKAKHPAIVDYYGEEEPIELGPDENMHDIMVELVAKQAVKRGYVLGAGIMSSKKVGINHKEFGVTSFGVIRFAEVTMLKARGIDMHKDAFSVKITGGPNGDVAGNGMRLLLERCPQVAIKLVIDGSGAIFDPKGLQHDALRKVILQSDIDQFDVSQLNEGGFLIYRSQTKMDGMRRLYKKAFMTAEGLQEEWISNDEFYKTFNSLAFTVEADLFIPAGGRPETIDMSNYENWFNTEGQPTAGTIVEGANSFITPDARAELQKRGVIIIRDASANKCGVISSSYEIIANLMMSDEEFLANKPRYVADVMNILNHLSELEADAILKTHTDAHGSLTYTEASNQISREINYHYTRMFDYFRANPVLCDQPAYQKAILSNLPKMIAESEEFTSRIANLPAKVKYAILAAKLAANMVYSGEDDNMYAYLIQAQVERIAEQS